MKVIDLFAGVGGLSLGFSQAGFDIIYANEYDKSIAEAYKKNHPKTIVDSTDIRDINFKKVFEPFKNKIDVVMGGPPCQGFSQKGKRVGLDDERNFMFKHFFKVIKIVNPEFVLLENVPSILSAENGYFKQEILNTFTSLGYEVKAKVLKAENFGVPQTRRRAVFLARKNKLDFDLPDGNGKKTTVSEAINDLPLLKSGQGKEKQSYATTPLNDFQKSMRHKSLSVKNHIATKHSRIALERLSMISLNGSKNDLPIRHRTKSIHSGTWTRLKPNGFARTITTRFDTPSSGQFTLPFQDRCITVREAARIQSFPDNFIFYGTKSSQMLQVGNAVPPMMAYEIAKTISKALSGKK
jgi:DNA (cytosine-5)-methyltransferase 1